MNVGNKHRDTGGLPARRGATMMNRDFFMQGRNKAITGLLLAVVPGSVAIAAAVVARRRQALRTAEPEPTEMDYDPAADAVAGGLLQRRWA